MPERSIVFVAWGDAYVAAAERCLAESSLPDHPVYLVTDPDSDTSRIAGRATVVRHEFRLPWKRRTLEGLVAVPEDAGTVFYLDTDTRVLGDVSLAFEQAERHGIAMTPAPTYTLEHFREFGEFMRSQGIEPRGELVFNAGIVFYDSRRPDIRAIFTTALDFARRADETLAWSDQPFITLAMEQLGINPYTLSPGYNYRGRGELAHGPIRIWHSTDPCPPNAATLSGRHLHRWQDGAWVEVRRLMGKEFGGRRPASA